MALTSMTERRELQAVGGEAALLVEAARLARLGRYEQAERLLPAPESDAITADQLDLLARISAQTGRRVEAERLWRRALQLDPQNRRFRTALHVVEGIDRPRVLWLRLQPWVLIGACGLAFMGHMRAQAASLRAELHASHIAQEQLRLDLIQLTDEQAANSRELGKLAAQLDSVQRQQGVATTTLTTFRDQALSSLDQLAARQAGLADSVAELQEGQGQLTAQVKDLLKREAQAAHER